MTISATQAMRDIVSDPEFALKLGAHLRAEREKREAFLQSETFQKMLTTFLAHPGEVAFSNEEASYFPEAVKTRLGWDFATKEDLHDFVRAVGNPQAATVAPGSLRDDPKSSFGACSFEHFGLQVFMLFGQGTSVHISNRKEASAQ